MFTEWFLGTEFLFPPIEVGTIAHACKSDLINIRPYKKSDLENIKIHFVKSDLIK